MEHLTVFNSLSGKDSRGTTLSELEIKSLLTIIQAYSEQAKHTGYLTVAQTLPPMQLAAIQNKIELINLMF